METYIVLGNTADNLSLKLSFQNFPCDHWNDIGQSFISRHRQAEGLVKLFLNHHVMYLHVHQSFIHPFNFFITLSGYMNTNKTENKGEKWS